jgi:hypothetical protein
MALLTVRFAIGSGAELRLPLPNACMKWKNASLDVNLAEIVGCLPTFWDILSVPPSKTKQSNFLALLDTWRWDRQAVPKRRQANYYQPRSRNDRLCGLVVRVSGYRYRGPGVRVPALPEFLRSNGSGTGSTQPREVN